MLAWQELLGPLHHVVGTILTLLHGIKFPFLLNHGLKSRVNYAVGKSIHLWLYVQS